MELWGLGDQGVASGTNFLTLILLARVLAPSDFGYFVLAFTLLQLATILQTALFTRPHNVLGAARRGDAYRDYTRTAAVAQLAFAAALALFVTLGAGAAQLGGVPHALVFLATAPAIATWQLQEFGRRVLYTEERLSAAFANTALTYGGQVGALLLLRHVEALTAESALVALALASLAGSALAVLQLRSSLSGTLDRSCLRDNWDIGRWLAGADVSYWLSTNFYVYLAAVVIGPVASAVLKAAQTLLGPISVFQGFFLNYLPVRFSRALGQHPEEPRLRVMGALTVVTSVTVVYCLAVGVLAGPVLRYVYGDEYAEHAATVRIFGVYYVLLAVSLVIVAVLSARRLTHRIFVAHTVGALLSLVVAWPLLETLGPSGAVVGMIISWTASTSMLWRTHRVSARGESLPRVPTKSGAPARGA